MPINAHPEFLTAEKEYHKAGTLEEKIEKLQKMISHAPAHKGGENLRAQLKTRYKKLKEQLIKSKKSGKSSYKGIKKQGHQIVIIGKTNSGKSSLLNILTNAKPKISEIPFTTTKPIIGILTIETVAMQIIENPSANSEYYDKSITNSADTILLLINSLDEIKDLAPLLEKATKKQIIVLNIKKNISENELRKLKETMKSKKLNFVILNLKNPQENLQELKNKIFQTFDKIRVYTKEPKKEKSQKPVILNPNSTVQDIAEKILKGFSEKIKETKIWGPSSKFSGQKVGLKHKLKDLDIIEFKTR